jgi:hypothetical protein
MKLGLKILISFLLIFIIHSENIRRRLVDNQPAKNNKKKIKNTGFTRTRPVEQLGALPMKRNYRTVYQVFGSSPPRRRSTGNVNLNKRDCNKLCSDRIPHDVKCKHVVARANFNGSLECVCLKSKNKTSVFYKNDDYCYSKKGCLQKNAGESCLS